MNERRTRRVNLGYAKQTALSFLPSLCLCLGLFLFVPIVALLGNGIPSFSDPSLQPPSYLMHPVSYVAELTVPAFGLGIQRALLEAEGVPFTPDGRADLSKCRWDGT